MLSIANNWGIGKYSTTVSHREPCYLDAGRRAIQRRLQGFRLSRRHHLIVLYAIDCIQELLDLDTRPKVRG